MKIRKSRFNETEKRGMEKKGRIHSEPKLKFPNFPTKRDPVSLPLFFREKKSHGLTFDLSELEFRETFQPSLGSRDWASSLFALTGFS